MSSMRRFTFPAEQTAIIHRSIKGLTQGGRSESAPVRATQAFKRRMLVTCGGTETVTAVIADGPHKGLNVFCHLGKRWAATVVFDGESQQFVTALGVAVGAG